MGRARLIGRAIDYLSFYVAARPANRSWTRRRRGSHDRPTADFDHRDAGCATAESTTHELATRHLPRSRTRTRHPLLRGPVLRLILLLRDRCLKSAAFNIVVGERMAAIVARRGAPLSHLIPNWTDDREIRPIAHTANALRHEWKLILTSHVGKLLTNGAMS